MAGWCELAVRIRTLRQRRGWSQSDLAAAAGHGLRSSQDHQIEGSERRVSSTELTIAPALLHLRAEELLKAEETAEPRYRAESTDSPEARAAIDWFNGFIRRLPAYGAYGSARCLKAARGERRSRPTT